MVNTSQSIAFHSVNANVQIHDHDHTIMNKYICYDSTHFYTISYLYVIGMSSCSAKSFSLWFDHSGGSNIATEKLPATFQGIS